MQHQLPSSVFLNPVLLLAFLRPNIFSFSFTVSNPLSLSSVICRRHLGTLVTSQSNRSAFPLIQWEKADLILPTLCPSLHHNAWLATLSKQHAPGRGFTFNPNCDCSYKLATGSLQYPVCCHLFPKMFNLFIYYFILSSYF